MALKKINWKSIYNFETAKFEIYFFNEEDQIIYISHVPHPCELKIQVEAVTNHLLAGNHHNNK